MSSQHIQEQLQKHGYTPGDALTIGPADSATQRLWVGIGAFMAACIGALTDSFLLLWAGIVGVGVCGVSLLDKSAPPALRLEAEGIWRGESLIAWSDVRGCERVVTLNQEFIEFTFVDGSGREKTQRSLAAPALYRHLLDDNEAKPEASREPVDEAPIALANQPAYRSAPQPSAALIATSKVPPTSWWRALVRFVFGQR